MWPYGNVHGLRLMAKVDGSDRIGHHAYDPAGAASTIRTDGDGPGLSSGSYWFGDICRRLSFREAARTHSIPETTINEIEPFGTTTISDESRQEKELFRLIGNSIPAMTLHDAVCHLLPPAQMVGERARQPEAFVRPPVVVDGGCDKTDQYVLILVETAPQRPQISCERVRREVAWHLDVVPPPLEAPPPRKRVAQEEYRRLPVVCETMLAKEKVIVPSSDIPYDAPIPVRPLSERLIGTVNDTDWGVSKLIRSDPQHLGDPEIAKKAKAGMMQFNALSKSNGRKREMRK